MAEDEDENWFDEVEVKSDDEANFEKMFEESCVDIGVISCTSFVNV
jgi:hypothetical protein